MSPEPLIYVHDLSKHFGIRIAAPRLEERFGGKQ
jgi:hypothetical protein